jgi:hypothetical protein
MAVLLVHGADHGPARVGADGFCSDGGDARGPIQRRTRTTGPTSIEADGDKVSLSPVLFGTLEGEGSTDDRGLVPQISAGASGS